ncbi:MAG: sugar phosphate isomerase/epimerase [Pirellulales bacterium]|nr:sugar phosphate isomerase/epimerase [Pirellulales bacterium]
MKITRREMLKAGTCGTGLWMAGAGLPRHAAAAATAKIPIGLGLWSVREECKKDLPAVLGAVGEMGYQGVELAHDDYGFDGPAWRKFLDKNGLKCCGMHTTLPKLEGDAFKRMVDFQQALDNRYLILAAVPKKNLESIQGMHDTAKLFDELAEKLRPHGMKIGYHCHGGDFQAVEGQIPWVVLGAESSPDVILQLDVGNCLEGGGDYLAMLTKFPGRAVTVHLKEHGAKPGGVLGEGMVQWNEVFRICETAGGTQWYIVEDETRKGPEALDAVRRCLESLRKMGK